MRRDLVSEPFLTAKDSSFSFEITDHMPAYYRDTCTLKLWATRARKQHGCPSKNGQIRKVDVYTTQIHSAVKNKVFFNCRKMDGTKEHAKRTKPVSKRQTWNVSSSVLKPGGKEA